MHRIYARGIVSAAGVAALLASPPSSAGCRCTCMLLCRHTMLATERLQLVSGPNLSAFWPAGWVPTSGGLRADPLYGCPLLLETRVIFSSPAACALAWHYQRVAWVVWLVDAILQAAQTAVLCHATLARQKLHSCVRLRVMQASCTWGYTYWHLLGTAGSRNRDEQLKQLRNPCMYSCMTYNPPAQSRSCRCQCCQQLLLQSCSGQLSCSACSPCQPGSMPFCQQQKPLAAAMTLCPAMSQVLQACSLLSGAAACCAEAAVACCAEGAAACCAGALGSTTC
jgi:hypothetical protein